MTELKEGQEVTINIPFTYTIGDEGFYSNKTLKSIEDCKLEVLAEIDNGVLREGNVYMEVEAKELTPKLKYILIEDGIHIVNSGKVILNEKIRDEDLHEYYIAHKESIIEDLYRWIGEGNKDSRLMKEDLQLLLSIEDEYVFSSNSTNSYIYSQDSDFNEICEELLELNKKLKNENI